MAELRLEGPAEGCVGIVTHLAGHFAHPANFDAVTAVAAWHDKPSFYVVTTEDLMIPADAQRFFAGRMGAAVTEIAASHSGLVSQPEEIVKVIEAAAQ